jgi:hypothetical protein
MAHGDAQTVLIPGALDRSIAYAFDTESLTSDGGGLLLAAVDRRLHLTESLASAIRDERRQGQVAHDKLGLLRQRVFGLALGYADCNDASRLAGDPVHELLKQSSRRDSSGLASQPTLSRFENGISSRDLIGMSRQLRDGVIRSAQRHYGRQRVRRIVLDLDPTCDRAHGRQQLISFNGHYASYCYLPMCAFVSFDDHAENHLIAAMLRSGSCKDHEGAIVLMRRLLPALRKAFPKARVLVRLDGGFGNEEILTWLEEQRRVDYVVNLPANKRMRGEVEVFDLMDEARWAAWETGESAQRFGEMHYAAEIWDRFRRVIVKAEVTLCEDREPKDNPRFVVTNLRRSPRSVFQLYNGRGDIENRIKELKLGLSIDRTSCTRFFANQLRVLLTAAAYVLLQELRLAARGTACESAQVDTLRLRLLKIGARVAVSVRRVLLHGPQPYPWLACFGRIARRLVAGLA